MTPSRKYLLLAALAFTAIILMAFHQAAPPQAEVCWESGGCLKVKVLESDYWKARGLMNVERLPEDEGILLKFGSPGIHGEWMKNMLISTDFIWLDAEMTVIHIHDSLKPCDQGECPVYRPPSPATYGVEANAGYARRHNITAGMKARIREWGGLQTKPANRAAVCFKSRCVAGICFGGSCVDAELATNPAERSRGLMFRESLPTDGGMLFLLGGEGIPGFWMKNTLIPLDIIWIDSAWKVVDIDHAVPCTSILCGTYSPPTPVKYVLEVNGGYTDAHDVRVGEQAEAKMPELFNASATN